MSKLRNSRPDTLQRSSPSCRLPGCCSAAVMPWLPPACLVGVRVMQELVSIDWIKDSENPNIQTGRSKNCQFNSVDEVLAETALEAMENHYWHLCGSMVLFALFTSLVSEEEKQNMVQKLLSLKKPTSIKFGTPKFPEKVGVDTLWSCHCGELVVVWLQQEWSWVPVPVCGGVEDWWPVHGGREVHQDTEMYQPWRGQGHSQQGMW